MLRYTKWVLSRLRSVKSFLLGLLIIYLALSRRSEEESHIDAKIDTAAAVKTTTELRYTSNLRTTFNEWLKIMKNLDVTKFKSPISEKSDVRKISLFDLCLADKVQTSEQVEENEEKTILGEVTGDFPVFRPLIFPPGTVCHDELEIYSVSTKMTAGVANGRTEITFKDNNVMQANLHRGVINGLVRKIRCKYGHCDLVLESENESIEDEDEIEATYLGQLNVYTGGQPETSLYGWWFPVGEGALYCTPNENDRAEGDDCVYLYADISTGIVGQWRNGHMVKGRPARLQSFVMSSGLLKPEMKILEEREPYHYFQSTNTTITNHPMVTDIFEDYHVYISTSSIKDAGEGIFAKVDFEIGDLVAIYNGIRLTEMEHRVSKESRRSPYSIHGWENMILDIPKKYQSLKNYKATSGHKANHSKKPNGEYFLCEHPRFGEIVCVYAKKPIKANEEIFVDYGYIEKYLKTQSAIEGMLKFAKHVGGFEDNATFKQEMKRTLGFFREKIEDIKPYLAAAKMAKNFMKS